MDQRDQPNGPARWRQRAAGVVATVVQAAALLSLVLLVTGRDHGVLGALVAGANLAGLPVDANLFIALVLAVLGAALRRRKRAALLTLVLFEVGSLLQLLAVHATLLLDPGLLLPHGDHHLPAAHGWLVGAELLAAGLASFLLVLRPAFPARLAPGAWWRGLAVLTGGLASVVLLGWAATAVFPGTLGGAGERFVWVANHATGELFRLRRIVPGHGPAWLDVLLDVLAALAGVAALWVFLRGVRTRRLRTDDEELRLRALLVEHGEDDSLGYFATRRDKSVVFAPSGRAAVTYRVLGGTTVASGDPIGEREAWPHAVRAWLAEARRYGWLPGVLGASERGAGVYAAAGLRALEIGDEAVLDVREFGLTGPERRALRQAVRRIRRAGYTAEVRRLAEIPAGELAELCELAQRWRGEATERGFSMALGRLGDPTDVRCVLVTARDAEGRPRGLLSFVPWGRRGLSLDLMRRDRAADNGLTEYLLTELVAAAPRLGVHRVSLNFAMFRAVFAQGERIGAGPVLRSWRRVLGVFSRFFQLESLYRATTKYGPAWVPRYLCYTSARRLPRVGLVAGTLEGFVPVRGPRRVLRAGEAAPAFAAAVAEVEDVPAPPIAPPRRPEQVRVRLAKLDRLRAAGVDPYPVSFPRDVPLGEVAARFAGLPPDTATGEVVRVAGRVVAVRDFGGLCFAGLRDGTGDLQLMLDARRLPLGPWRAGVDLGDHVGVRGEVVTSRRGELSVLVDEWTVTAKCLHPLPDKHKGLTDPETRVRRRYLELVADPDAAGLLRLRGAVVRALREHLHRRGYLEVETPMLQAVHGGANARPFVTSSNAYDQRLYLRIAPELYLKRLCVAGMDRVYELGRNFRNEGVDATHNPEFTMLEAYQAYADYTTMRELAADLVRSAAEAAFGAPVVRRSGEGELDVSGPWPVVPVYDAVSAALGHPVRPDTPAEELRGWCRAASVSVAGEAGHADLVLQAYEHLVEPATERPTFYTDFPAAVSPLTRPHRADPRLAERWDLVAFGTEVGTAYTELADPVEQRRRLAGQSLRAASGDVEAMGLDEEFLLALEHGMPPTGGLGLGVDRLLMMLTGASIRRTVPFPFARPRP
ncbi:lysyl-tRNA synthetase, class 2 [Amycolatopsis arida]|uniref:Lysine--tRNA ligase n=1 Tax=Amycolatopsis arida TaxID=587909 RepID=A0A1I6AZL1_9PSEU|nr:bifunctional lysylphosphatidylglycerol synthetase/lysine--tRNA ligase LysX [Amycolatopsis arida]TDX92168.1 lysyl-tRNA synthetase class 2 [Amycolatopsis arida]SFQ74158.1 lysyl-tRNA synthetase, class 2 [Amycolatopsis arida]